MTKYVLCVQEMLFSMRERLKKGVVTGADVEEFEDVEQMTASRDHTQKSVEILSSTRTVDDSRDIPVLFRSHCGDRLCFHRLAVC